MPQISPLRMSCPYSSMRNRFGHGNHMQSLPRKLKKDAIVEALCEVRFDSSESKEVPELVVGRLADCENWKKFGKARLPISDVPAPVRQQNASLRNQPVLELRDSDRARVVKIGSNVVSYHALAPYPGWDSFRPELDDMLDFVFGAFEDFQALRLGFRYVNLVNEKDHLVPDVMALNYSATVAGTQLEPPLNLNYQIARGEEYRATVRIASPDFVPAKIKEPYSALIDVDVSTPEGSTIASVDAAKAWIIKAHDIEKDEFFKLFHPEHLAQLIEE